MLDKDFEQISECFPITKSENYFKRYATLLAVHKSSLHTWEALEAEFFEYTGGNRFTTFQSFKSAMSQFYAGRKGSAKVFITFKY